MTDQSVSECVTFIDFETCMGATMLRPITRVVKNVIYTLTWHYLHGFIG